jgi:hypothetical protein
MREVVMIDMAAKVFVIFPAPLSALHPQHPNILGSSAFPPVFSRSAACHVVSLGVGLLETTHFEQ